MVPRRFSVIFRCFSIWWQDLIGQKLIFWRTSKTIVVVVFIPLLLLSSYISQERKQIEMKCHCNWIFFLVWLENSTWNKKKFPQHLLVLKCTNEMVSAVKLNGKSEALVSTFVVSERMNKKKKVEKEHRKNTRISTL